MSTSASIAPVPLSEVRDFDHETDVLVVGFGAAGAAAALEAAAAGARVTILERLSGPGGSSAQSGGELYLGGGTAVQQACGFEDSPEAMFDYLVAALGPHADEEKLRAYCQGSVEHFEWFRARGVPFEASLWEHPAWMPPTKDGLMWLGENTWPFTELAKPAPRGHRPARRWFAGSLLMEVLARAVADAGITVHLDTRAKALVVHDDAVVGLVARSGDQFPTYRARGGVVLTTGGFVDNEEMVADHAPVLLGHGKVSDGGDDGSGILMGCAVGAATRRMGSVELAMTYIPAAACAGIVVNASGRRFMNEDVYPGRLSHHAVAHEPGPCWVLVDEQGWEGLSEMDTGGLPPQHAAETLAELEEELGMPRGALEATVAEYNEHAAAGHDPVHHKDARWVRPLVAPYAVLDPRVAGAAGGSPTGVAGFTLGGLSTTVDGAVQHVAGGLVPGLYAAGRAAAGMHGEGYVSGTSLGDGTFFGRRAGRAAASSSLAD